MMNRFLVTLATTVATLSALPAFADSPFTGKTGPLKFEVDSAKSQLDKAIADLKTKGMSGATKALPKKGLKGFK